MMKLRIAKKICNMLDGETGVWRGKYTEAQKHAAVVRVERTQSAREAAAFILGILRTQTPSEMAARSSPSQGLRTLMNYDERDWNRTLNEILGEPT